MIPKLDLYVSDDGFNDGIIIIRHDLGDLQLDQTARYTKGRCIGNRGFREQMAILRFLTKKEEVQP